MDQTETHEQADQCVQEDQLKSMKEAVILDLMDRQEQMVKDIVAYLKCSRAKAIQYIKLTTPTR